MKFIVLLLLAVSARSQSTGSAKTSGSCSPAITGSNNTFKNYKITCNGITKEQGDSLVRIMNEILAKQLEEAEVLRSIQHTVEESASSGFLTPGNEKSPPNVCDRLFPPEIFGPPPPDRTFLYLGNSPMGVTSFPQTIIGTKATKKAFLSLDKKPEGLSISLDAYNQDHKIMVTIVDNEFTVNQNRIFRKILSPDNHSLRVLGENNEEVLNVKFLNPLAISLTADFYLPNGVRLNVTPTEILMGGRPLMSEVCLTGAVDIGLP